MLRVGDQCRPTLLIGAQSLSGMVRMVEAVLVALQASSGSSDSALGNGTELHHRRVLTLRGRRTRRDVLRALGLQRQRGFLLDRTCYRWALLPCSSQR